MSAQTKFSNRLFLLSVASILLLPNSTVRTQTPKPQLVFPARVTQVYDGDTLTAEITLPVRIRLLRCWAPELSDRGGRPSRDNLKRLAEGKPCLIQIPLEDVDRLSDVLTFGRLLAEVWVEDVNVSTEQVRSGHATRDRS